MPNHFSALKRMRQTKRRTVINRNNKGIFRASLRTARKASADAPRDEAHHVMTRTHSSIDRAARKGIIHKNAASRLKSRLAKRLRNSS
jgi:small subunit ribosomal protein S20